MFKCIPIVLSAEDQERFWGCVDNSGGGGSCWEWTKARDHDGYGKFKRLYAHRVAWTLANNRAIPAGHLVCHVCDNPSCCNPAHLFVGTHKDNHDDMKRKGRGPTGDRSGRRKHPEAFMRKRGCWSPNARLTDEQIKQIRSMCVIADGKCINASEIAEKFGIRRETVHRIRTRKTWSHL